MKTFEQRLARKLRRLKRKLEAETDKQKLYRQYFYEKREEHGLKFWKLEYKSMYRRLGICKYAPKTIVLSKEFVEQGTDEQIKDTILHEIAHALTQGHHHDQVWKAKCIEIGGNGMRKCNTGLTLLKSGWAYVCPNNCFGTVVRKRAPKHHILFGVRCASCKTEYTPKKWEENTNENQGSS